MKSSLLKLKSVKWKKTTLYVTATTACAQCNVKDLGLIYNQTVNCVDMKRHGTDPLSKVFADCITEMNPSAPQDVSNLCVGMASPPVTTFPIPDNTVVAVLTCVCNLCE